MLRGSGDVKALNIPRQGDVKLNELPKQIYAPACAASLALFFYLGGAWAQGPQAAPPRMKNKANEAAEAGA